jgi:hypothetical protein
MIAFCLDVTPTASTGDAAITIGCRDFAALPFLKPSDVIVIIIADLQTRMKTGDGHSTIVFTATAGIFPLIMLQARHFVTLIYTSL